jgi:hypothetical protein
MDFVIEVDSASIETEKVYLRSAFCVKKAEPEVSLFCGVICVYACRPVCFIQVIYKYDFQFRECS